MTPKRRRQLGIALRVVAALAVIGACAWFVRGLDLHAVGAALSNASILPLLVAAALNLITVWLRAARFCVMLHDVPNGRVPVTRMFWYHLSTYAASNVLPGRAGEVLRVWLLKRREGVAATSVVSAAVVEKIVDLTGLLAVAAPVPLLLPSLPPNASRIIGLVGAGGLTALVAAMIASRFDPGGGDTFVARIMGGLRILRSGARLALAVFYTLGAWALDVAMVVLCLRAVHLDYIQPAGALLILVSLNLAISLPSTPGQLGAFEGGAVLGLHFLGAPPVESTAFALLYHAVQVIPVTILGLPGMRLAGKAEAEVGDLEKAGTLDGNPP